MLTLELATEINEEIEQATARWGQIDKDPHEMLNAVAEECLEVIHAVNHREDKAKVHQEIVHAIGVLIRLDEML